MKNSLARALRIVVAGALLASPAAGTAAAQGKPARWPAQARVPLVVFGAAEGSGTWRVLAQAAQRWRDATGIGFELRAATERRPPAAFAEDGTSTLSVLAERRCSGRLGEPCLGAHHHGATKVHRRLRPPGPLEEVDIELAVPAGAGSDALMAVALHELGHAVGLGHSCLGNPCSASERGSVMYPAPLEPGRRTVVSLSSHDHALVARLYPELHTGERSKLAAIAVVGLAAAAVASLALLRRRHSLRARR